LIGAANHSAGHSNRCRESSAPSKAGWSTILAGRILAGDVTRRFAGG